MNHTFYHLCSEGNRTDLLFHDEKEFVDGMNIVALSAWLTGTDILAFCLMDNHFHFILSSSEEEVSRFASKISQIYMLRRRKRGDRYRSEPIRWDAHLIGDDFEYLLNSIAYVLKNPINAWFDALPYDYPWSSASLYFRGVIFRANEDCFSVKVGALTFRERRRVIGTDIRLPEDWRIVPQGHIWPGSYVRWKKVEGIYGTLRRYQYFMTSKIETEVAKMMIRRHRICIPDQEMREHARQACIERYGHGEFRKLSVGQRLTVAELLIRRLGSSQKQVSRILHLDGFGM